MTDITATTRFAALYPTAHVRGRLVTRLEERTLGWATVDVATAEEMGREQLGWFVGGHPGLAKAADQLGRLDSNPEGGVWVVVTLGRDHSRELFTKWPHSDHIVEPPNLSDSIWRSRKIWVAMPEDLNELLPLAKKVEPGVAGMIILDPPCIIHKARGGTDWWGRVHRNDRPQHIVNFLASLHQDGWQPPLLLLTEQKAKAVNTEAVARTYCLNGFRFIAGDSFACWEMAIELK